MSVRVNLGSSRFFGRLPKNFRLRVSDAEAKSDIFAVIEKELWNCPFVFDYIASLLCPLI
jgi:hypothetical protein